MLAFKVALIYWMSKKDGLYHTFKELNNSLKDLFKGSPSITFMLFCIGVITTYYVLSFSLSLMTGFAVLLVITTSLVVYFKTKNYGEASLYISGWSVNHGHS